MNDQITARDVLKGACAGLVSGLAGAWVMSEFQSLWSKYSEDNDKKSKKKSSGEKKDPATVKAAEMVSEKALHRELTRKEKKYAGPVMHYAMGGTSGLIYGIASEVVPFSTIGAGMPFGAAVWVAADNLALPALGLAKSPTRYPVSTHAYALASHLVYGLTTEVARRLVREALD